MAIEGEDYIFDRYAFLHVEAAASAEVIAAKIKERKSGNHPDRIIKAGQEVKDTAEQTWHTIEQCEEILLDSPKRAYFDERLQWFKAHKPELISKNGHEIIDLSAFRVDIAALAQDAEIDTSARAGILEQIAGVKPRDITMAKRLYEGNPGDAEAKAFYEDMLVRRLAYLTNAEDITWAQAGVYNRQHDPHVPALTDAAYYREDVEDNIAHVAKQAIPEQAAKRATAELFGMASPLMLPAPESRQQIICRFYWLNAKMPSKKAPLKPLRNVRTALPN